MSKVKITTPKGTIQWAYIQGEGKKDLQGRDSYTIDLVASAEDAAPLMATINELWEENKPKGAKEPKSRGFKILDSGDVKFTFKTGTTFPSGDKKEITIYDAKAKKVKLEQRIGNGSIGRVSGMAAVYDAGVAARGVTLYLDCVQLVKLVAYDKGADFVEEEDGDFVAEEDAFVAEAL